MPAYRIKEPKRPSSARTECVEQSQFTGTRRSAGILNRAALLAVVAGTVQVLSGSKALAISGTWSQATSGGLWSLSSNWFSGNIADGNNFTADFGSINLAADNTVNLNTSRTIGNLIFGDTTPSNNWTLANNGNSANVLTLGVASGTPLITVNNQTTTISAVLAGSQGIDKRGAGTLILNNANTYTSGTNVTVGTLAIAASGAVLPAGQGVAVNNGSTLNYGNGATINNIGAAISTMVLSDGNFRVSGGTGDFYQNKLIVGTLGGTIDLTGSSNFWMHFTGAGAGITANANSTWTGGGSSQIRNDTGALLPITINIGKTVTSSVNFANGSGGFGYLLNCVDSTGALYLKNPTGTNTANFRAEVGTLRVDDMAALGSGVITLAGSYAAGSPNVETTAWLNYSGPTASSSTPLTLDVDGGQIYFSTIGTTLTLNGLISETGGTGRGLAIEGAGGFASTLVLTAANTYTGKTGIGFGGILSIPTIADGGVASPLGMSSSAPANLRLGSTSDHGDATLRYTGPTASTNRGATLVEAAFKTTIDVATAGTTLTMSGQIVGAGGLTKAGLGTLLLTNNTNSYANGTTINAGTLAVGASGAVLPAEKNVTVNSGANFNYGANFSNGSAPIGTLTLNNGTYRVSGGSGDLYLNQLVIGETGGSVDFSGSNFFFTHFTGSSAGITVNTTSTWTGAAGSRIQNDNATLLPITLNNGAVVTSSINMANGASGFGFRLLGDIFGRLYLKNPTGTNSANFHVESGFLQVDDMDALGNGAITLAGAPLDGVNVDTAATLYYSGTTASSNKPLVLDAAGGDLFLDTNGTTLTLNGVISETGGTGRGLTVNGDNGNGTVLVLTAANSYTGPTAVNYGGILSIPTIANGGVASPLGASSNAPANLRLGGGYFGGDGTLRYTGATASTDRGVTLDTSDRAVIDVTTAGTTLTMSGQFFGGSLYKAGPGTLRLNGSNTYTGTTTVLAGTLIANAFASPTVLAGGNGGLDVQGGKFVFDYTGNANPVATVKAILTAGYAGNFATGQIRATTLAPGQTLGYGDNGIGVTVMLTLPGDANLDGAVNFNDFLVLQTNFGQSGTQFDQGNFNYDGQTNFNDFLLLQTNFGQSIGGDTIAVTSNQIAALTAFGLANAVPEPSLLATVGLGVATALRRSRRIDAKAS